MRVSSESITDQDFWNGSHSLEVKALNRFSIAICNLSVWVYRRVLLGLSFQVVSILIFDKFSPEVIDDAKQSALEYALISKPFTYNRMNLPIRQCVENIAKGKFAETMFMSVLKHHGLVVDVDSCQTPFWSRDRRDFVLGNQEWDVKSLFLHRLPPDQRFDECPALIPNKSSSDQWASREIRYVPTAINGPCYVFVFFGPVSIRIDLDTRQEDFLSVLCLRHREAESRFEPFAREWFFDAFPNLDGVSLELSTSPIMAITGVASSGDWDLFAGRPAGPVIVDGVLVYRTAIENMACRAGDLPSFASVVNWNR